MEIKDQRTKSLLWLLLILIVAVTAGAGSYLLTLNDQQKQTDSLQSQINTLQNQVTDLKGTTTTTPTTTKTDETADWKTFTSKVYHYTVKYPLSFTSIQDTEADSGGVVLESKTGNIEFSTLRSFGTPDSRKTILSNSYTVNSDTTKILGNNSVKILEIDETSGPNKAIMIHAFVRSSSTGYIEFTSPKSMQATLENILSTFQLTN